MLTAVKGTYDHGQITLHETPPVQNRAEVIVMFLEEVADATGQPRKESGFAGIRFGSLAGRVTLPADFNEPLDDLSEYM
ncbi:hypothetical protein [Spirosoma spitsbergense]|jgi:hypothetical protein|uniref:hypothetical protein n=1 Tax=Spirosoma spitsbergense TaxID=431554 RepID=UPI00036953D5|nr:hypothetical protein [Spirosoma spitsbergense]